MRTQHLTHVCKYADTVIKLLIGTHIAGTNAASAMVGSVLTAKLAALLPVDNANHRLKLTE